MAFSTFVFLILLNLALSLPEPDPNVKVVVDVEVDDHGCGCCNNENCCTYDGVKYRSGYNIVVGCAELCCKRDGEWEFKGIIPGCGNCTVGGEPWVKTFDDVPGEKPGLGYSTMANGTYVLTQKGLTSSSSYGVIGDFPYIKHYSGLYGTYIKSVTNKDGTKPDISLTCHPRGGWQCTDIQVTPSLPPTSVVYFSFTNGAVKCKGISRMNGLTVMFCGSDARSISWGDLPWVYIYVPTTLHDELYGLCNTFTGQRVDEYIPKAGNGLPLSGCLPSTTPGGFQYNIDQNCGRFIESWKYP